MDYNNNYSWLKDQEDTKKLNERQLKSALKLFGFCSFDWTFFLTGIVFVVIGLFLYKSAWDKEKKCTEMVNGIVTAKIVKEKDILDQNNEIIGHSIDYEGPNMLKYTYNDHVYYQNDSYIEKSKTLNIDAKVDVYVDPADPYNYYAPYSIKKAKKDYMFLVAIGSITSIMCIVFHLINKRRANKNAKMFHL